MVQISTKVALQNLLGCGLIEVWGQGDDVEELKQSCPAISKFHDGQHGQTQQVNRRMEWKRKEEVKGETRRDIL